MMNVAGIIPGYIPIWSAYDPFWVMKKVRPQANGGRKGRPRGPMRHKTNQPLLRKKHGGK